MVTRDTYYKNKKPLWERKNTTRVLAKHENSLYTD
jgi:hypothetical protein